MLIEKAKPNVGQNYEKKLKFCYKEERNVILSSYN